MTYALRLSDSALRTLHTCERKFQIDRILAGVPEEKEQWPSTVLGTAWGIGVADYFAYQNQDKALFALWLAYYPRLEDEVRTQEVAANMLIAAFPIIDNILQDWEVVSFQGKKALELSFRLNMDSSYYFVGYVDIVLQNRWTGKVAVMDVKTTAMNLIDLSPLYQNSPQGIGYSIVLDRLMGENLSEYDVFYFVGQMNSRNPFQPTVKQYQFSKTLQDRLNWFISLGMDVNHLEEMAEMNVYPQRGNNCLQYNKPCKHFGVCGLHSLDVIEEYPEDTIEYQFVFDLESIIDDHVSRIKEL
jgi:hypothetical protein